LEKIMVIARLTGSVAREIHKGGVAAYENAKPGTAPSGKPANGGEQVSVSAQVSERSKAAIKAYRLAIEAKPDLSRASRLAQIKTQIIQGVYNAPSMAVSGAILKNVA